jgi:hypothetical protein
VILKIPTEYTEEGAFKVFLLGLKLEKGKEFGHKSAGQPDRIMGDSFLVELGHVHTL